MNFLRGGIGHIMYIVFSCSLSERDGGASSCDPRGCIVRTYNTVFRGGGEGFLFAADSCMVVKTLLSVIQLT